MKHLVMMGLLCMLAVTLLVSGQEKKASSKDWPPGYKGVHWKLGRDFKDAKTGKTVASYIYEFRFDKQGRYDQGKGCFTDERSYYGNILRCPLTLPNVIPANMAIVQVTFSCTPENNDGPCGHTVECPGGAICNEAPHVYPTTPDNLPINRPRSVDWWGWTNDGNHATLILDALVQ